MNAHEHDRHTAYVSHISHVSSMALALTVLEKEKDEKNIFNLASGGFDSTARLAKSSSKMWTSIFINNSDNILIVLEEYINQLSKFKESLEKNDKSEIDFLINNANKITKILD
jgi:prephenate dehydrogenase